MGTLIRPLVSRRASDELKFHDLVWLPHLVGDVHHFLAAQKYAYVAPVGPGGGPYQLNARTIHDGRAFSATEAKRQGKDAQKLLNHTDASTTRIYLRGREIEVVDGPRIKRKMG